MPATVTDLAQWRASHPPMLRLWQAQCRLAAGLAILNMKLALALCGISPRRR